MYKIDKNCNLCPTPAGIPRFKVSWSVPLSNNSGLIQIKSLVLDLFYFRLAETSSMHRWRMATTLIYMQWLVIPQHYHIVDDWKWKKKYKNNSLTANTMIITPLC